MSEHLVFFFSLGMCAGYVSLDEGLLVECVFTLHGLQAARLACFLSRPAAGISLRYRMRILLL